VPPASSIRIGMLADLPVSPQQALFASALRLGLDEGPGSAPVDVVTVTAPGLPFGSLDAVVAGVRELADAGVLLVVGPAITDNALAVRPVVDALGLPAINYAGGAQTCSEWMFQYPIGSLEDEPAVLIARLVRRGLRRVALVVDRSALGERYRECFDSARGTAVEVSATISVSPTDPDVGPALQTARTAAPDALVYLGLGVSAHAVATSLAALAWSLPVVANSALMFGHARPEWTAAWEGWEYVDAIADDNRRRAELAERLPAAAASPGGCAAWDIGRLAGEALARAATTAPAAVRAALERLDPMPAASGREGTRVRFGPSVRQALDGEYLVLRTWVGGLSREVPCSA
jgi:ABC-type branched-subunit amino acid transport system substrate-binding protein